MLYKFFSSAKAKVSASVTDLVNVEWFNNQYEATIPKTPVCFVEFTDPLIPEHVSKELVRGVLNMRLHVVEKILTKVDNVIPDSAVEDHETLALAVLAALNGKSLSQTVVVTPATETDPAVTSEVTISMPLIWGRWQHFHKYQGYMVTTIDFTFKSGNFEA